VGLRDKLKRLERRLAAPRRPVRINVVYEDVPEQVLYTVTVPAHGEEIPGRERRDGD
jgi:hypothetical protein